MGERLLGVWAAVEATADPAAQESAKARRVSEERCFDVAL